MTTKFEAIERQRYSDPAGYRTLEADCMGSSGPKAFISIYIYIHRCIYIYICVYTYMRPLRDFDSQGNSS